MISCNIKAIIPLTCSVNRNSWPSTRTETRIGSRMVSKLESRIRTKMCKEIDSLPHTLTGCYPNTTIKTENLKTTTKLASHPCRGSEDNHTVERIPTGIATSSLHSSSVARSFFHKQLGLRLLSVSEFMPLFSFVFLVSSSGMSAPLHA